MLMVTAVGSGDSRPVLSAKAWEFLGPAMELKTKAEEGNDSRALRRMQELRMEKMKKAQSKRD